VDLFNTKKNKNANLNLLGTSGAGKTFTMQLLALRMRMRGIQCFILAPIKGHEFRRACKKVGGEFIKIAPGSPHCINIMEIRHTISPEMELIDELDYSEMDSMLARKIQQLMTFFSLLIPDMSNEEEQMLDEALIRTYAKFGITHDNDSLYRNRNCYPPQMKPMPIIGDLHAELLDNPLTQRLAVIISRFVTGSAQSFNQQTNVDLTNKYIVLDLSELKGKLLPVGMFIALDYVWDTVKADRTKKKAIMIDEIWQLIGASSNRMAAEFCLTIFKTIRGFGGAAISATQDLSDFFGLEDGKYGRAIINNSKNKIILNLEPDEAKTVQEVLKLTRTELRSITQFERGEALVCSNSNKVPVVIKASQEEQEMITTDRAELEAILRERQKENTHSEPNAYSDGNAYCAQYTHSEGR
jgi:type IV secretory pathway VirB4 component